jgi:hypothetical protein
VYPVVLGKGKRLFDSAPVGHAKIRTTQRYLHVM